MIDVSNYNDGARGGKVRVRAHIEKVDAKSIIIRDVPYGVTTQQLADSILKANDSGKIKIKSVTDNTAKDVELNIQLAPGISPDQTIDALYLFTDCEVSISPNACVIIDDKPHFIGASELLRHSVQHTKDLLLQELQIKLGELEDDWHYSSLEKIFIENRIYRDIEEETTWEGVLKAIDKGLDPFKKSLRRAVTQEDIIKLTEIRIKRISKFDSFKADEHIRGVEDQLKTVQHDIDHLNDYSIRYYENILKKYGKGKERLTEIRPFETIQATTVAIANTKLYVNYKEGFIGTGLKKDELAFECSDLDNIIVFRRDGKMVVTKVADKSFIGKDIIYLAIFQKSDERTTYNMIYSDGKTGIAMAKRFNVSGITRDKEYDLTKGNPSSRVLYFTANPNGEAEVVSINLNPASNARVKQFDYSFADLEIKGRSAQGNQVTKYPVKSVKLKEKGRSTLSAPKIWFDDTVGRLNKDGYGKLLGHFSEEDKLVAFYKDGTYELTDAELTNRFDTESMLLLEQFNPEKVISAVYFDAKSGQYNVKRFHIETQTLKNRFMFIKEGDGNYLEFVTLQDEPVVVLKSGKKKADMVQEEVALASVVDVAGWKSVGKKLAGAELTGIELIVPEPDGGSDEAPTLF